MLGKLLGKPGPFQIIENDGRGSVDSPMLPPRRRYACPNYNTCLSVACAFNWDSFTCRGCNGEIDQKSLWKAHQEMKRDKVADSLCEIPEIPIVSGTAESDKVVQLFSKRI